jgi:hypothetical protein
LRALPQEPLGAGAAAWIVERAQPVNQPDFMLAPTQLLAMTAVIARSVHLSQAFSHPAASW